MAALVASTLDLVPAASFAPGVLGVASAAGSFAGAFEAKILAVYVAINIPALGASGVRDLDGWAPVFSVSKNVMRVSRITEGAILSKAARIDPD